MIIDNAGTYTLRYTATDDCGKTTTVDRTLEVQDVTRIFGVQNISARPFVMERTDDAVGLADPVPQHSDGNGGWVGGSSPFDSYMPWKGIEKVEDPVAGTLVKIPKFWYKIERNDYGFSLQISNNPVDGFLVSPAHADRGDGFGERDFAYVGRYHCADDYKSKPNVIPTGANDTISDFRTHIHNLGSDVWQWDFAMYWTIAMLYLVEFADWNSQAMIGGGCTDNGAVQNTGLTDAMTYHTGTTNTLVAEDAYGHVQYRYIEDLWANVYDWIDGIYFIDRNIYCIKNPSQFSSDTGGTLIGTRPTTSSNPVYTNVIYFPEDDDFRYAIYPYSTISAIENSQTHDAYNYSPGNKVLHTGGSIGRNSQSGLFRWNGGLDSSYKYEIYGSRLMKLPSA